MLNITYQDTGPLVYFDVNVQELFGVNIAYPGMRRALRHAFQASRGSVPYKTGLLRSSYTLEYMTNEVARLYFDPTVIVGAMRGKYKVKDYYAKYLVIHLPDWLLKVIRVFYISLLNELNQINKEKKLEAQLSTAALVAFLLLIEDQRKEKEHKDVIVVKSNQRREKTKRTRKRTALSTRAISTV